MRRTVISLLVLLLCAPALFAQQTDWPMFRGNTQLTGVANCHLPEKPELLWKISLGEVLSSSAAISGNRVFVGCDNTLFCCDLADGKVQWKRDSGSTIQSSPAVHDGRVFFGNEAGLVHALDARTGVVRWTFKTDAEIISSANCVDGKILVGSYDGNLYCLTEADGKLIWKFHTEGRVHGTPGVDPNHEVTMIAGCDEHLRVIRIADGKQVTETAMGGVSGASAAIKGDHVFVGTFNNTVLGIDWRKGKIDWQYADKDKEFPFYASASVGEQLVIIGGRDKVIHALDQKTGKETWTFKTRGRVDSSAAIVGDRAYVGSSDGKLYALDIATGSQKWSYELGPAIVASPAAGQDRLIVGTEDGGLYCFGPPKK